MSAYRLWLWEWLGGLWVWLWVWLWLWEWLGASVFERGFDGIGLDLFVVAAVRLPTRLGLPGFCGGEACSGYVQGADDRDSERGARGCDGSAGDVAAVEDDGQRLDPGEPGRAFEARDGRFFLCGGQLF